MARLISVRTSEGIEYGPILVPRDDFSAESIAEPVADLLAACLLYSAPRLVKPTEAIIEALRSLHKECEVETSRRIRAANREREGLAVEQPPQTEDTVLPHETAILRLEEWRSRGSNRQWRLGRLADGSWSVLLMEGFDGRVAKTSLSLKMAVDLALEGDD